MSVKNIRVWRRYSDRILALSEPDGVYLDEYIRKIRISGAIYEHYELLDFQHYRKYRRKGKIIAFLQMSPEEQRFKFLVGKN
ncbi:MAG TPA: hypothetical protein VFL76_01950 [Edaphocola sp.]|nr:hypothetical protein [Edaphocola sp.]